MKSVVITSGGFDPLHIGHLEYLQRAKKIADIHVCIVNSDKFLMDKKGYCFMPFQQRIKIIQALKCVDFAMPSIDEDNTVCKTLELIREQLPDCTMYFVKGGDRHAAEIPELEICGKLDIAVIDGLGEKIESSSSLVERIKNENIGNKPLEK